MLTQIIVLKNLIKKANDQHFLNFVEGLLQIIIRYYCSRKFNESNKFRRVINYILAMFTCSIYLRLMLESYLVGFLSCINELWIDGPTSSIVLLIIFVLFLVLFFVIWIKSWSELYDTETSHFREFFSGIKQTKASRIYFSTFLLRRVVCIMIAVVLNKSSVYLQTGLFAVANLLCLMFTVFIRPFVSIKDNIIETINDFAFGFFCTLLLYLNQKNTWTDTAANAVIYFLLACSMLSTLINFCFMIYKIIKWAISKCSKSSNARVHVTQDHNIIIIKNPFHASNINNATTLSNSKISAISGEETKQDNMVRFHKKFNNMVDDWNKNRFVREEQVDNFIRRFHNYDNDEI